MIGGRTQPKTDFSQGPVWRRILDQAGPLIVAQLVHLLYNVVDRIYLGHMGDGGGMALTGVGLTFPIVTLIMGFAALFGTGGVPRICTRIPTAIGTASTPACWASWSTPTS